MNATLVLDAVTYGILSNPRQPVRWFAMMLNYSMIYIFAQNTVWTRRNSICLAAVVLTTTCAYHIHTTAVGMSTVWAFMYGHKRQPSCREHALFWASFFGVFLMYKIGFWPWPGGYLILCNAAHLIACVTGRLTRAEVKTVNPRLKQPFSFERNVDLRKDV